MRVFNSALLTRINAGDGATRTEAEAASSGEADEAEVDEEAGLGSRGADLSAEEGREDEETDSEEGGEPDAAEAAREGGSKLGWSLLLLPFSVVAFREGRSLPDDAVIFILNDGDQRLLIKNSQTRIGGRQEGRGWETSWEDAEETPAVGGDSVVRSIGGSPGPSCSSGSIRFGGGWR